VCVRARACVSARVCVSVWERVRACECARECERVSVCAWVWACVRECVCVYSHTRHLLAVKFHLSLNLIGNGTVDMKLQFICRNRNDFLQ